MFALVLRATVVMDFNVLTLMNVMLKQTIAMEKPNARILKVATNAFVKRDTLVMELRVKILTNVPKKMLAKPTQSVQIQSDPLIALANLDSKVMVRNA